MSTFSSVVRKPGQKFAPKAAPRRNVTRRNAPPTPALTPEVSNSQPSLQTNHLEPSSTTDSSDTDVGTQPLQEDAGAQHVTPVGILSPAPTQEKESVTNNRVTRSRPSRAQPAQESSKQIAVVEDGGRRNTRQRDHGVVRESLQTRSHVQTSGIGSSEENTTSTSVRDTINASSERQKSEASSAKRKRKTTPRAGTGLVLSQPTAITPPMVRQTASSDRATSELSQRLSVRESIERATEQAAAVSELAQSIGGDHPVIPSQKKRKVYHTPIETDDSEQTDKGQLRKHLKKNSRQKRTVEQQAAEVVANATGETDVLPRRRGVTPDELEQHIIEEEAITMGDLCQDRRWGMKSKTEKEMQENWPEILKRRREAKSQALEEAMNSRKRVQLRDKPAEQALIQTAQHTVEMDIVNGNIVALSREIDREEQLNRQIEETIEVLEDKDIYKRVNQSTIGIKNHLPNGERWDDQNTELFYQGLRMFGTDFMMISNMIPGKSRKQVKLKYNVEERLNWNRVQRSLAEKQSVDLGEYAQMTGLAFNNALDVYKQIEEDEKRLREEDEQRRRDEGIVQNEADVPLQSIEGDGTEGPEGTEESARDGRLDSAARQVVERATKKRQTRKTNVSAGTRRGRQATSKAAAVEGTEERLGTIDEVAV